MPRKPQPAPFDGALLIHKPRGATSHDVVDAARRELVLRFISPALIAGGSQIPSIILALGGAPAKVVVGAWVLGVFASFPFSVGLAFVNASELADRLSFLLCVVNGRRQPSRLAMLVRYVGFTLSQLALTVLVLMAASWIAHWIA